MTGDMGLRAARPGDWELVGALLRGSDLPLAGVTRDLRHFTVAETANGEVVGAIGLELYGSWALLRSAVVGPAWRGAGVGRALVEAVLRQADGLRVERLYLLTTTAEGYFTRFGFSLIERSEVPEPVLASSEFRGACPSSAVVMRRRVRGAEGQ